MTAIATRSTSRQVAAPRQVRFDAADPLRADSNSAFLRRWARHQVAAYQDLLETVSAAPRPRHGA